MLGELHASRTRPVEDFLIALDGKGDRPLSLDGRTNGISVYMASGYGVPLTLVHHVERIRVLPETVVLLTVVTAHVPFVDDAKRLEVQKLALGFYKVVGTFGFMENPNVPRLLEYARKNGLDVDTTDATYFLGRETILGLPGGKMGAVEETFFGILSRNARHAGQYFGLPPAQVVEIGLQVDL